MTATMFPIPLSVSAFGAGAIGFALGAGLAAAVFLLLLRRARRSRVDRIVGGDEELAKLRDQIRKTVERRIRRHRREENGSSRG